MRLRLNPLEAQRYTESVRGEMRLGQLGNTIILDQSGRNRP